MPSLNALRAFDAVARHLNYRLAAEDLSVTPAAVKQLVAKLEDSLGTTLIERSGRGLILTRAGEAGREGLAQGFDRITRSVETMRASQDRNRLIVSVEPSFAAAWLVPRLEGFRAANPQTDVLIDSSLRIVDLHGGAADIAVRFGADADAELITHRLFDEELCAFCSPSLAAGITTPEDLSRAPLLHWDLSPLDWAQATRKWMNWPRWLAHVGASHVTPTDGLRFSDYNLAVQAAVAGQGVILGSWPVLQNLVQANLLVSPLPERVQTDIGYDLVTTGQTMQRPEVRRFMDWISEAARQ